MIPSIFDGDKLEIAPLNGMAPSLGSVVLTHDNADRVLVHRVISVRNDAGGHYVTTKGDVVHTLDPEVSLEQVLGQVTRVRSGQIRGPERLARTVLALVYRWFRIAKSKLLTSWPTLR